MTNYSVDQLEKFQESFEHLRRLYRNEGDHHGQAVAEFALEMIRQYQMRPVQPEAGLTALERFALAVLDDARESYGDLDGAWVHEKAVELGIFTPETVTAPCDPDNCPCAEVADFPQECYRYSAEVQAKREAEPSPQKTS